MSGHYWSTDCPWVVHVVIVQAHGLPKGRPGGFSVASLIVHESPIGVYGAVPWVANESPMNLYWPMDRPWDTLGSHADIKCPSTGCGAGRLVRGSLMSLQFWSMDYPWIACESPNGVLF